MYQNTHDKMVFCPYNRYHIVSKLRIQKHIIKCQKKYPDVKLVPCVYNYTHRFKPEEMLSHYEVCSHKMRVVSAGRYEPDNCSDTSVKNNYTFDFPKNRSPANFGGPRKLLFNSKSDSENKNEDYEIGENVPSPHFCDDSCDYNEEDEDLKPLPLPKTVSKAFLPVKLQQDILAKRGTQDSNPEIFGRGIQFSTPKGSSEHFLQDVSTIENVVHERQKNSLQEDSCSASIISFFDDTSTFMSQDIIFDDDDDDSLLEN